MFGIHQVQKGCATKQKGIDWYTTVLKRLPPQNRKELFGIHRVQKSCRYETKIKFVDTIIQHGGYELT